MPTLLDLSTELLVSIVSFAPSHSLVALTLSCKRLQEVAIPKLYKSLYFWGTGYQDTEERIFPRDTNGELFLRRQPPGHATRIHDLDSLVRTIEQSRNLGSLIQEVELTWGPGAGLVKAYAAALRASASLNVRDDDTGNLYVQEYDNGEEDEERVDRFLRQLAFPPTRMLCLSSPNLYSRIYQIAPITHLKIRHEGEDCGDDEVLTNDLDQLHALSVVPYLQNLYIDGWSYWGDSVSNDNISYGPLTRAKSSSMTELRISTMGRPGIDLNEVLSWPRALRSFSFECAPHDGRRYVLPSNLSSTDFIQPLQHCRESLEQLMICCADGASGRYLSHWI